MELRQVAQVVAVVDHGGFTRAARELHIAQPSLSQSVRALERELGCELFFRLGRSVVLTPAGEAFLEPARALLRDAATARAAVAEAAGLRGGHLDLCVLPTLAVDPMVPLLASFQRAHPGVRVRVQDAGRPADVAAALRSGQAELGIVDATDPGGGFVVEPLGTQPYLAVAPAGASIGRSGRTTMAELANQPLVTTPPGTSTRQLTDAAFEAAGLRPGIAVETSQREALIPLVLAGAGVTLLPEPLARDASARGAVALELDPEVRRSIVLLHRDAPLSPAAGAFRALALTAKRG